MLYQRVAITLPDLGGLKEPETNYEISLPPVAITLPNLGGLKEAMSDDGLNAGHGRNHPPRPGWAESNPEVGRKALATGSQSPSQTWVG